MKSNVCGYVYEDFNTVHMFSEDRQITGRADVIQSKFLKKYPKHSTVIKELFMCNKNFVLNLKLNELLLIKEKGFVDVQQLKLEDFYRVQLKGIGEIDKNNLYFMQYLLQDDRNSFVGDIVNNIELTDEMVEKLNEIENSVDNLVI